MIVCCADVGSVILEVSPRNQMLECLLDKPPISHPANIVHWWLSIHLADQFRRVISFYSDWILGTNGHSGEVCIKKMLYKEKCAALFPCYSFNTEDLPEVFLFHP